MRFTNYDGRAKRVPKFSGATDNSDGCPVGYTSDPNDPTGCVLIGAGASGCPAGMVTDPTDSTSCIAAPAGSSAATSSGNGTSSLLTGIGTALTSIFGTKPVVKPVATGTSVLVPALFALGAIGVVIFVVKKKK